MKYIHLLVFTFFFLELSHAQPLEYKWHRGDNLCSSGSVESIETTSNNELLTLVRFGGQIDADPSVEDTLINGSYAIIKYDEQRQFLWTVSWMNNAFPIKMKTDHAGNIYCYGDFYDSLDADPGTGVSMITETALGSSSFVIKLSPSGTFQWVKLLTSSHTVKTTSLVFDNQDNLYLAGTYIGTFDTDPDAPVQNLDLTNGTNVFMIKLKPTGAFVRSMCFGNEWPLNGCYLDIHNDNLFFSGQTVGTIDIDPSTNATPIGSVGYNPSFVAKYDTTFNFVSVALFSINKPPRISINDAGSLILSGVFNSSFDSNPNTGTNTLTGGSKSGFVIELDHQFNFYHSFTIPYVSGSGKDFTVEEVDVHQDGHYTLLGTFRATYDFDPIGTNNLTSISSTEYDVYVAQYNPGGILISAHIISNTYTKTADDLHVTAGRRVFVGGGIRGTTDIDPLTGNIDPGLSGASRKPILIEYTAGTNSILNLFDTICKGETYNLGDLSLTESGDYSYYFPLSNGLDSIVELHLTVNQPNLNVEMVNGTLVCTDTNAISYQWFNCETQSIVLGYNDYSFTPIDNAPYAVIVEQNNCFDTSLCQQFTQFSNLGVPEFDWAGTITNSIWNTHSIITDQYDNFYVAGTYIGVSDVDLFGGNTEIFQSQSSEDLMLMKYNNDGVLQWVYTAGIQGTSAISENVDAMAVDNEGNVYFTGRYENTIDFDPNEYNTVLLNDMSPSFCCAPSIYFAKLNPNGQLLWVKSIGAPGNDMRTYDLAIDSRGNIAIGGEMEAIQTDFDPGPGIVNVTGGGFVARYDSNGNYLSVLPIPSGGAFSPVRTVDFGPSDELVIAGRLSGSGDFDPGPGTLTLTATSLNSYTFFASYDSLFNLNWAKQFSLGNSTYSYYFAMDIDQEGQIYLCTNTFGLTDFSGGLNTPGQSINTNGLYLVKFNSDGLMVSQYGFHTSPDPVSIDLDASGNLYVIGRKYGSTPVNLTSTNTLNSTISSTYVAKYLNNGTQAYGFLIEDEFYATHNPDIAADAKGNFFITSDGHATNAFDVDPSSNNNSITTPGGYVVKYGHSCSPINTAFTVSGITATITASGAHYTFKRCSDHSIVASGFNPTFTACEENDFYGVIEMGTCIDSTSCFHLNPNPTVSIAASTLQVCTNESITFTTTSNQLCTPSYQWMVNGLPISGETNASFTGSEFLDNDQVYCEIIGNNFMDTLITNTLTIAILPIPNATINFIGNTLNANPSGNSYSWIDCTTLLPINGEVSQTFTPSVDGTYACVVTDGNGCQDTSDCLLYDLIGIDAYSLEDIELYPNPTDGTFFLKVNFDLANSDINILSPSGSKIESVQNITGSLFKYSINHLTSGIYFIEINTTEKKYTLRIIKN